MREFEDHYIHCFECESPDYQRHSMNYTFRKCEGLPPFVFQMDDFEDEFELILPMYMDDLVGPGPSDLSKFFLVNHYDVLFLTLYNYYIETPNSDRGPFGCSLR